VDPTADELVGEDSEPAFDLVDPGRAGRGEVQVEAGVAGQPGADGRRLVGSQVVADQVHVQLGRHSLIDRDEELAELDRPVLAVQFGDDAAVGDVERGEQAGGAVPDVVGGLSLRHAGHHRQHRLRTVQGLHAGLLVHA
jgi:hypothetical protein